MNEVKTLMFFPEDFAESFTIYQLIVTLKHIEKDWGYDDFEPLEND